VNGVPSWNFTPLRNLNSQVRSSIAFHDTASPGTIFWFESRFTSGSKMCSSRLLLGERL
jgi:hypothetical protein